MICTEPKQKVLYRGYWMEQLANDKWQVMSGNAKGIYDTQDSAADMIDFEIDRSMERCR